MRANCKDESLTHAMPEHEVGVFADAPRVLLADDQRDVLEVARLMLDDQFRVVGTVQDGLAAIESAISLRPDVLVLDISMPVVNGIEAANYLRRLGSHIRIIFLTVHTDHEFVEAALLTGAFGYVFKASLVTDLVPAILAALEGDVFVSRAIQLHQAENHN